MHRATVLVKRGLFDQLSTIRAGVISSAPAQPSPAPLCAKARSKSSTAARTGAK